MAARTHRPYPPEFKAEAVRLAKASGQPLQVTARQLDVSVEALRSWVKQGAVDAGEEEGLTSSELEELRRLRRENLVLRQEREILVKAAAFFAKESATR